MFAWPATNLTLLYVLACPCGVEHRESFELTSLGGDVPAIMPPADWTVVDGVAWCPRHRFTREELDLAVKLPLAPAPVPVLNPDEDWHPPFLPPVAAARAHVARPSLTPQQLLDR